MNQRRMGSEQENDRPEGLNDDIQRFVKTGHTRHEAEERAKALDGREEEVRRRAERAEKDNAPTESRKSGRKSGH